MTTVDRSQARTTVRVGGAARTAMALGLSVASGVMLLLAFPPYGLWPLMWIGFVPYLFAQHRLLRRKWSALAPSVALLIWLGPFMARLFGTQFGPIFTFLGVLIAIITYFTNRERWFHELTGYRWFVLHGAINWVGFEMLRATLIPLAATSAFIGYTQATQAWLIQPVSVFTVYGLDLLIMLVNFALAQGVIAWYDGRARVLDATRLDFRPALRWMAIAGVTLVIWIGLSLGLLFGGEVAGEPVRVAAVQPNFTQAAFWDEVDSSQARFDAFAQWARQAAGQGAQVIYTPEMVFNFDPQLRFTEKFRALARETGAHLFIAYSVVQEGEPWRNEALMLAPTGEFSHVYGKNHVYGEPSTPSSGVYPVFDTPLGRLATLICHDANFTDVTRRLARNGAQIIAAPINEFGGFGEQYWTNVTFRAVENRTAFVVAARQAGSAIIDAHGRQVALAANPDGEQRVLVGDVAPGSGTTPLRYLGDWMGWLTVAGWLFFVVLQNVTQRRAKKAARAEATAQEAA